MVFSHVTVSYSRKERDTVTFSKTKMAPQEVGRWTVCFYKYPARLEPAFVIF